MSLPQLTGSFQRGQSEVMRMKGVAYQVGLRIVANTAFVLCIAVVNQNDWHTSLLDLDIYSTLTEDAQTGVTHRVISIVKVLLAFALLSNRSQLKLVTDESPGEEWRGYAKLFAGAIGLIGALALLGVRIDYLTSGLLKTMMMQMWFAHKFSLLGTQEMWAYVCIYYAMGEAVMITLGNTGILYWMSSLLRSCLIVAFGTPTFSLDVLEQSLFQLILCTSLLCYTRNSQTGSQRTLRTLRSLYMQESFGSEDLGV